MRDNGKRYTNEFKADVIRMVKEGERSVPSIAKDLGINVQTIHNWKNRPVSKRELENYVHIFS